MVNLFEMLLSQNYLKINDFNFFHKNFTWSVEFLIYIEDIFHSNHLEKSTNSLNKLIILKSQHCHPDTVNQSSHPTKRATWLRNMQQVNQSPCGPSNREVVNELMRNINEPDNSDHTKHANNILTTVPQQI